MRGARTAALCALCHRLGWAETQLPTNVDFRDLLTINGRVVQLSHQSREVSDNLRQFQADHKIPANKILSTVRTNATRWGNQFKQVQRNNVLRPVVDPVLSEYRREHSCDTAILVSEIADDDSDSEQPRGPFTVASKAVARKDIRLNEDMWYANLEAEAFLNRPHAIKQTLEHRLTITGAQGVALMYALKKQNGPLKPLQILQFPRSVSLQHRKREDTTVQCRDLSLMISTARLELVKQIDKRFINKRFSDARLIQIFMSKQMPAAKLLSDENLPLAKALYLKALRSLVSTLKLDERRSSPRKKKQRDSKRSGLQQS